MARSIGVGGMVVWPVALALGALVACGGGSLGSDGGRGGAGGTGGGCPQPTQYCYGECAHDPIAATCTPQGTWECASGSLTHYWCGGAAGSGGAAGGGAAGSGGAAGAAGAAETSGGGSGAGGGGGAAGLSGTFGCAGVRTCALGTQYCAIQEPSTSTQTAEYGCEPLPSGCSGATDCACLCPNGSCPRFPFALTYLCTCGGSSGALTVDCNGE
jgi:hypothetical protein